MHRAATRHRSMSPDLNRKSHSMASEAKALEAIREVFENVYGHSRILNNMVLPTWQEQGPPTSEYDVIVICSAGIIIFESKGWNADRLVCKHYPEGKSQWFLIQGSVSQPIRDPIAQGGFKTRYLSSQLPGVRVKNYVVPTNQALQIDPKCTSHVVGFNDLPYLARMSRFRSKKTGNFHLLKRDEIDAIANTIVELSSQYTIDEHIASLEKWIKSRNTQCNRDASTQQSAGLHDR